MASKGAFRRLTKEFLLIQRSPPPFIVAKPLDSNILEWHYVITGPPGSPYEGQYYGKLLFPSDYPYKPPGIKMTTPNGRFQTDFRLCLSMSDYHPGTWNPAWSVSTILTGLLSFMLEDIVTTGSIVTTVQEKRVLASQSRKWNSAHAKFKDVFPDLHKQNEEALGVRAVPQPVPTTPFRSAGPASDTILRRANTARAINDDNRAAQNAPPPTTNGPAPDAVGRRRRGMSWINTFWAPAAQIAFASLVLYLLAIKIFSRAGA